MEKTLQQQYNLIKEGKGNKDDFLKSARRVFPEFITSLTNYNDAVTILKGKSILNEGIGGVATMNPNKPDWFKIFDTNLAEAVGVKNKKEYGDQNEFEKIDKDVQKDLDNQFDNKDPKNIDNLYGQSFLLGYLTEMGDPKNATKTVDELKAIIHDIISAEMGAGEAEEHGGEESGAENIDVNLDEEEELEDISSKIKPKKNEKTRGRIKIPSQILTTLIPSENVEETSAIEEQPKLISKTKPQSKAKKSINVSSLVLPTQEESKEDELSVLPKKQSAKSKTKKIDLSSLKLATATATSVEKPQPQPNPYEFKENTGLSDIEEVSEKPDE